MVVLIKYIAFLLLQVFIVTARKRRDYPAKEDTSCYIRRCDRTCQYYLKKLSKENEFHPKTIFFVDATCNGGLNSRQACSVESAALHNKERNVVVLFTGNLKGEYLEGTTKNLLMLPNVKFYRINLKDYAKQTSLEDLFATDFWTVHDNVSYTLQQILGILTLHKYGGIYLNMDMLVTKSFDKLPKNFVSRENKTHVGSGVLGLSPSTSIGSRFSALALGDLSTLFKSLPQQRIGDLYNRVLSEICTTRNVMLLSAPRCRGYYVFHPRYFYPTPRENWTVYYRDEAQKIKIRYQYDLEEVETMPLPSQTEEVARCMFADSAGDSIIAEKSQYVRLAKIHCPSIYKLYGRSFGN